MAILQGFPPSNTISPSIRITEQDLSFIPPALTFANAGIVGFASKGPVNLPVNITSVRQLNTVFGYPHPEVGDPYLIYAAMQYLLVSTTLYCVRVAVTDPLSDEQALTAQVAVPAAGTVVQITSDTVGPYTFNVDSFFRWRLNGVLSSKTLVVLAGTYNVGDLVADLNAQVDTENDGIQFFVSNTNTIGVETLWAYGPNATLELVSVQDAIYGDTVLNGNPTGLGTGMTKAEVIGTLAMYPNVAYQTPGNYDFTGLTGLNLVVLVDGTDNVLIDQVAQVIDLSSLEGQVNTIGQVVIAINNELASNGGTLPGGWQAVAVGNNLAFKTLTTGQDARIRISSSSTAAGIFGLDTITHIGTSPSGVTGDPAIETFAIVSGGVNNAGTPSFTVLADSTGIEGNQTQVVITNDVSDSTFIINVFNNGGPVEAWGNLTKDQSSAYYIETYMALVSDFIRVVDNTNTTAGPTAGTYQLSGGTDGIPADPDDQDALLIGNNLAFTGMYSISDPEQIDIDLVAVPGHSSTSVVMAMLNLCQNIRQDCLAIVDPPFGLTVQEIIAWQNGAHPLNLVQFNSDFGALYWPWVQITDTFNRVQVWIPPSGSVMATIARSDFLAAPWFAPAGLNRGQVPGIVNVYNRPSLTERDAMYGNANAINPIVSFPDADGFFIWGQKTLQRLPTLLDRVNVRRCLFYIEKQMRQACRTLLFEPNDAKFQQQFVTLTTNILRAVQIGRGIYDFIIDAGADLNTPDVIDRNEFRAKIGIQPVPAVEFIFLEFDVFKTGAFVTANGVDGF
jgi:phage tail sheath protein FI